MGSPNDSWIAPSLSELDISKSNCELATTWAAAYIQALTKKKTLVDVSTVLMNDYLRSMIPPNSSQPSDADLTLWTLRLVGKTHEYEESPEYDQWFNSTLYKPIMGCEGSICKKLDWQGDPDVSGIGMMICYYVALVLATLYFLVLSATRVGLIKTSHYPSPKSMMDRVIESFQESVNTFLDASLIFAAAMLGAAVVRHASFIRGTPYPSYGMMGSVFMSAFSIFPAMILQAVADGPRKHWVRHLLWFTVIVSTIAADVLYRCATTMQGFLSEHDLITLEQNEDFSGLGNFIWPDQCEDTKIKKDIALALKIGHIILAVNFIWWFCYLLLAMIPHRWKRSWSSRPRWCRTELDWRTSFSIVNGLFCIAIACFFIGLFHRYRISVHKFSGSDKDKDWQFGQVLALATWVPVIVDFFAILFYGPERGLGGKVSEHYRIVPNLDDHNKDVQELERLRSYSPRNLV